MTKEYIEIDCSIFDMAEDLARGKLFWKNSEDIYSNIKDGIELINLISREHTIYKLDQITFRPTYKKYDGSIFDLESKLEDGLLYWQTADMKRYRSITDEKGVAYWFYAGKLFVRQVG